VPNKTPKGQSCGIRGHSTAFLNLRIVEFFEDLVDREVQFLARCFQRKIGLQTQVNIESMEDFG
jgi:hypothetical protein